MGELYIPYKFYDDPIKKQTTVFCREVNSSKYREISLENSTWLILDPFRYPFESIEEKIVTLERVFKTNSVEYISCDRFLIKNYSMIDFNENDYKYVSVPPETYTTKIAINQKRFYNLFTEKEEWTNQRGSGYADMQDYHMIIKETSDGNILYRRISDQRYQIFTRSLWNEIKDSIDIIFSNLPKNVFETEICQLDNSKDYVFINENWMKNYDNIDEWYISNISKVYELSFLSSRNISDILSINTRKEWEFLTDDIILSVNPSLYESPKVNRFLKNYCTPGKYKQLYKYSIGEYLLRLMEGSNCKTTLDIWKIFSKLGQWNSIISNIFNYERLNPDVFMMPDSCVYIDNEHLMTRIPLDEVRSIECIDYVILLAEGSYITFDVNEKKTTFNGAHPLCRPLFLAGKRCIENYMLCSAKNFDVDIEAISDLTDKNAESLKILITITKYNLKKYQDILPRDLVERISNGELNSIEVPIWLGKTVNSVTTVYDPKICIKSSEIYLDSLMYALDKIR